MPPRWPGLVLSCAFALLSPGCVHDAPIQCYFPSYDSEPCAEELAKGNLEAAEAHCDRGIARTPSHAEFWYLKGLIAMAREDWGTARQHLSTALRHDPTHDRAHSNLGVLSMREGAYAQAEASFREALRLHPESLDARYNLALALMKLGRAEQSRAELRVLLAAGTGPDTAGGSAAAHHALGVLDYTERKLEGAAGHLSQAVMLAPDRPDLWHDLGTVLKEQGRLADAAEAFGHCVRLNAARAACREGQEAARAGPPP